MGKVLIWFVIIISTVVLYCLMKRLKQQSERKWRCDNGRRDSGSGADHPCSL